jgi:LAGLIDADG endonuclease.
VKRVKVKTYYKIVLPSLPLLITPFKGSLSKFLDENQSFQCNIYDNFRGLEKDETHCINSNPNIYSSSYIQQFWVGLMDGDGTITMDENRPSCYSRSRMVISLNNTEKNRIMFNLIQKEIGGKVRIERKDKYVTWVIVSRKDIKTALFILNQYPLLTTRKRCQLEFMRQCIKERSVNFYLQKRDLKYDKQPEMIALLNQYFIRPDYFPAWLSGFIEAEGHFSIYRFKDQTKPKGFTIRQNNDLYILEAIQSYFDSHHKIFKTVKNNLDYYRIDMYGVKVRQNIKNHFITNPLLGHKLESYNKWIN